MTDADYLHKLRELIAAIARAAQAPTDGETRRDLRP